MGGSGAKEPRRSPTCGAWRRGGRSADAACDASMASHLVRVRVRVRVRVKVSWP